MSAVDELPRTARQGSPEHRAWLLACAERLTAEGEHALAAEARRDAAAPAPASARALRTVPCDDCGRPLSTSRIPDDRAFDWWSHAAAGRRCPA